MHWDDDLTVGYAPLDDTHHEFAVVLQRLLHADDAALEPALTAVQAHCRSHFGTEDAWMEETDFPARECHSAEHAAVLASIDGVLRRLQDGETEPTRHLARALADWFPPHVQHLDSALAHWVCKRRLGGRPVVLRGRIGARAGHAHSNQEQPSC